MQPQTFINFLNDYNCFIDSLPRNGYNHQFYQVIKSVILETYTFYKPSWSQESYAEVRRLQLTYESVVWQAHSKFAQYASESYYLQPILQDDT